MANTEIKLSNEQQEALDLMLSGKNVFLTGEAGTGKSTILRKFREQCQRECVFLAPTGIAAINVSGSTLHSFFMLKPGLLTDDSLEDISNKSKKALIRKTQVIVIDEISMVRSDIFNAIDIRLRSLADFRHKDKPFGGKQLILVGDFFQLPPVVKSGLEEDYLFNELGGIYAFQTPLWKRAKFKYVFLKTVHRQQNDDLFLSILNHLRHGDLESTDISLPDTTEQVNVLEAHLSRIYSHEDIDHLLIVYNNQTGQEKGELTAKKRNGIGFNRADAPVLSELTEKFLEERFLTEDELQTVSTLIAKYHRQWEERELL